MGLRRFGDSEIRSLGGLGFPWSGIPLVSSYTRERLRKHRKREEKHHKSTQKSAQHTSIGTMGNAPMRALIALMRALIVPSNCVLLQLALRSMHVALIFAHIWSHHTIKFAIIHSIVVSNLYHYQKLWWFEILNVYQLLTLYDQYMYISNNCCFVISILVVVVVVAHYS